MYHTKRNKGNKRGVLKNGLERHAYEALCELWGKDNVLYEKESLTYTVPEKAHKYTPDFMKKKSKLIIESKGRFVTADRQKMILVKQQHPDYRICIYFTSMHRPLYKGSKTTYKAWCDANGFACSDKKAGLPKDWK